MSKKNVNEPLPFKILKSFPERIWSLCDSCMELKDKMHWSDHCILPIAAGMAVAGEIGLDQAAFGYKISAMYAWRKYKEIYSFDSDLVDLLFEQADDEMDIPIDILKQMPYPCIFVQYKNRGFFAHFEHDVNNRQFEFRFWDTAEGDAGFPVIIHIEEDCTIKEALDKTLAEAKKNIAVRNLSTDYDYVLESGQSLVVEHAAKLLQLILYICADNSEKEENPEQKTVTRRNPESERKPKDTFREIRKWDVGFRIGSSIRRMKSKSADAGNSDNQENTEESADPITRKSSRTSPHARRGHWHHFWIGPKDSSGRQLILKWIAPIFINGSDDDNITTIHPVS